MAEAMFPTGPSTQEFGELIRSLREAQGLTAKELATHSGLTMDTIKELELGQRPAELDELFAIGRGLGMTVGAVFRIWEARKMRS